MKRLSVLARYARRARPVVLAALALVTLARPKAMAASPCPAIGGVPEWDATIEYSWAAAFTENTVEFQSDHHVSATAHLTCGAAGCQPGAQVLEWSGTAQGTGSVHDVATEPGNPPTVHHTDGDGPLISSDMQPFGIVYLDVDLVACTFRVTFHGPAVDTFVDGGDVGASAIGTLRGGTHPLVSAALVDASGSYPAHSDIWGGMHPDADAYGPQGGAPILGIAGEPDAGAATVSFKVSGQAEPLEVVVTPAGYDTWMPLGGHSESEEGPKPLPILAVLQKKGGGTPKTKAKSFTFELVDVSHEPGVCMNFPNPAGANPGPDLKFIAAHNRAPLQPAADGLSLTAPGASDKATATLSAYDFGAFGTVRVTADTDQGPIVGHLAGDESRTDILVPKRQDGSQIADAWRQQHPSASDVEDADAVPGGNGTPGDWLSAYEEYRGFFVHGETTDVAPHIRTDPAKIDVFVYDVDGIGPGDLTTARLGTPVHYVEAGQLGHHREINGNSGVNHLHVQDAIQVADGGLTPERTLGVTFAQPKIPVGEQSCVVYTQNIAKPDGCVVLGDTPAGSTSVAAACNGRYRPAGTTRLGGAPFPYTSADAQSPTTFVAASPLAATVADGTPIALFLDPPDVTAKVFAHEASHVMGLLDATNGECDGVGENIMSTPNCPGSVAGAGLFHPWAGAVDSRAGFQVRQ